MNKKEAKIVEKQFDIRVECLVPSTLVYRVLAKNEGEALEKIKKMAPRSAVPHYNKKHLVKATVYDMGSLIIRLVKNFRN